jgi:hypothetical protein
VRWRATMRLMLGVGIPSRRGGAITVRRSMSQDQNCGAPRAGGITPSRHQGLDNMEDATAAPEERAQRRRRLTKGPLEFREDRVDQPKAKGK